jgi:hypothetical protein
VFARGGLGGCADVVCLILYVVVSGGIFRNAIFLKDFCCVGYGEGSISRLPQRGGPGGRYDVVGLSGNKPLTLLTNSSSFGELSGLRFVGRLFFFFDCFLVFPGGKKKRGDGKKPVDMVWCSA